MADFLDIPNVPGVPPLPSYAVGDLTLGIADLIGLVSTIFGPQWGIYRHGLPLPVIAYENIVAVEHKQDFQIATYPIEGGGFQSYDKVSLPFDVRVRCSCGGSPLRRQLFLLSIDAVINSLSLFDVVTPEKVYLNLNFAHRDMRRTATSGAGLITVDLWLVEIRESAESIFANTLTPPTAGVQNIGNVQPQDMTPAQQVAITGAVT